MLRVKIKFLEYLCTLIFMIFISCQNILEETSVDNTPPESISLYESTYVTKYSVELIWSKNKDVDFYSYVIYRDTISNVTDSSTLVTIIYDQDSTRYIDMNLDLERKYYYSIFVFDKSGISSMSNIIYAITEAMDYSLKFDGINDYIEILDASTLDISGPITLESWIKFYGQSSGYIFWKYIYYYDYTPNSDYKEGNGHGYTLQIDRNMRLTLDIYNGHGGRGFLQSSPLPIDEWMHIAAVYDSESIMIFINGVLDTVETYNRGIDTNSINVRFGNGYNEYGSSFHFSGAIEGMRISTGARYYENFNPKYASEWNIDEQTVGLWRFDEDVGNTLHDYSGNKNHGVIYGAKWVLH